MPSVALCYSGEMRTLFVPAIGLHQHLDFVNGLEASVWFFWSIRPQNLVPYGPNVTDDEISRQIRDMFPLGYIEQSDRYVQHTHQPSYNGSSTGSFVRDVEIYFDEFEPHRYPKCTHNLPSCMPHFWRMQNVFQRMEAYERRVGSRFDWVLRLRPDAPPGILKPIFEYNRSAIVVEEGSITMDPELADHPKLNIGRAIARGVWHRRGEVSDEPPSYLFRGLKDSIAVCPRVLAPMLFNLVEDGCLSEFDIYNVPCFRWTMQEHMGVRHTLVPDASKYLAGCENLWTKRFLYHDVPHEFIDFAGRIERFGCSVPVPPKHLKVEISSWRVMNEMYPGRTSEIRAGYRKYFGNAYMNQAALFLQEGANCVARCVDDPRTISVLQCPRLQAEHGEVEEIIPKENFRALRFRY